MIQLILILFFSIEAMASTSTVQTPPTEHQRLKPWIALHVGNRSERDDVTQGTTTQNPTGIVFGARMENFEPALEIAGFSNETGNSAYKVKRAQLEFLGSARVYLQSEDVSTWFPYGTILAGVSRQTISTTVMSTTRESPSKAYFVGGAGLGTWGQVYKFLRAGVEFRALTSEGYSPNINLDFCFRVGARF